MITGNINLAEAIAELDKWYDAQGYKVSYVLSDANQAVTPETKVRVVEKGTSLNTIFYSNGEENRRLSSNIAIKDIKIYDDKVVVVNFKDGTTERAVTHPDDIFSLEQGISICLMKKLTGGTAAYNKIIGYALDVMDKNRQAEAKRLEEVERAKAKREKEAARKARRAAKKREEAIEIQKEAYLRAMDEAKYNSATEDDGK